MSGKFACIGLGAMGQPMASNIQRKSIEAPRLPKADGE